jgi:hypothetical protein
MMHPQHIDISHDAHKGAPWGRHPQKEGKKMRSKDEETQRVNNLQHTAVDCGKRVTPMLSPDGSEELRVRMGTPDPRREHPRSLVDIFAKN